MNNPRQPNRIQRGSHHVCSLRTLALLLWLLPTGLQAQFVCVINNGAVTISGSPTLFGLQMPLTIPDTYAGLPVTSIAENAFSAVSLETWQNAYQFTSVTIPDSVTNIGQGAFWYSPNLTSVRIGSGITSIGNGAFAACSNLTGIYFTGNAPSTGSNVFGFDPVTVYYVPGMAGWGSTFGERPTALWVLPNPLILTGGPSFGVHTNGFGFVISWATNVAVVVEACTNLANPTWLSLQTNVPTGGTAYFGDPDWTNHPARFYRVRSP